MSREQLSLLLPENCKLYLTFIWWHAQHLKMVQSLTITEACIQLKLLPSLVYSYSEQCSYFAKKKQKWWSDTKKDYLWTRSEVVFCFAWELYSLRPVRKYFMQRPKGSQTGLSSFLGRSHVQTHEKEMYGDRSRDTSSYRSEFVPVSYNYPLIQQISQIMRNKGMHRTQIWALPFVCILLVDGITVFI